MRKSLGTVSLVLFLGLIIGSVVGEVIGLFLDPDSVAYGLFAQKHELLNMDVHTLKLVVLELSFGIKFHFNLMSVVGVFMAAKMLEWYR